ncbi:MAG: cell division protein FtsQ/DivIB [Myxococcaceae bacterium]
MVKRKLKRSGPTLARAAMTLGVTLGMAVAAKATYAWALASPTFAVRQITFQGTKRAAPTELQKLAGLGAGQNLLDLDVPGVVRAMSTHPWIKNVSIARHLPSGLEVKVKEHDPVALVVLNELYLLDADGEPFKKVQPNDAVDLPLVTGVDRDAYLERPEETRAKFRAALVVVNDYQQGGFARGAKLSEVRWAEGGVALVTEQGQEIRLGEDDLGEKLARLSKVRAELSRRGMTADAIHLDNRTRPGWVTVKVSTLPPERQAAAK